MVNLSGDLKTTFVQISKSTMCLTFTKATFLINRKCPIFKVKWRMSFIYYKYNSQSGFVIFIKDTHSDVDWTVSVGRVFCTFLILSGRCVPWTRSQGQSSLKKLEWFSIRRPPLTPGPAVFIKAAITAARPNNTRTEELSCSLSNHSAAF